MGRWLEGQKRLERVEMNGNCLGSASLGFLKKVLGGGDCAEEEEVDEGDFEGILGSLSDNESDCEEEEDEESSSSEEEGDEEDGLDDLGIGQLKI